MSAQVHPTVDHLARMANVSRRTMLKAIKVRRLAIGDVVAAVEAGRLSLNVALLIARFSPTSQKVVLDAALDLPAKRQCGFVELVIAGCTSAPTGRGR